MGNLSSESVDCEQSLFFLFSEGSVRPRERRAATTRDAWNESPGHLRVSRVSLERLKKEKQ